MSSILRRILAIVLVLLVSWFAVTNIARLVRLRPGLPRGCPPDCVGADLRDLDLRDDSRLSGADLSAADLRAADLSGADLAGADLSGANLAQANLDQANLSGVNARGANLQGALLRAVAAPELDLSGANLTKAVLTGVDLTAVKLDAAVLDQARLIGVDLRGTDLRGAKLRGADLRGAALSGASLTGADLTGADLSGADLTGAALGGAKLDGASLAGTNMQEASLIGASLRTILPGTSLIGADLAGADLVDAELSGVDLRQAIAVNANLVSAELYGVDLRGADLRGAKLSVGDLTEAEVRALEGDDGVIVEDAVFHGHDVDEAPPSQATGRITLYTSLPPSLIDPIQSAFAAEFPDISLESVPVASRDLVDTLLAEGENGGIQADLIWAADPAVHEIMKEKHLLHSYASPRAAFVPAWLKDPDGYYQAGALTNIVVVYAADLTPLPRGWSSLHRSEYQGAVGFLDPRIADTAMPAIRALVGAHGWAYAKELWANDPVLIPDSASIIDQLATADLEVGSALDHQAREAEKAGFPISYVWPEEGAVSIPIPIAIAASTENRLASQAFVDFVLSRKVQQMIVEEAYLYSARFDVAPPEGVPSLSSAPRLPVDWVSLAKSRQAILDRWTDLFGDELGQ